MLEKDSLAFRTEVAFLGRDHVGSVKQLEGVELPKFIMIVREILSSRNLAYEDELLESSGLYTCVCRLPFANEAFLWIKAMEVKNAGSIAEIKVIHSTEESAVADEFLTELVEALEKGIG